MKDEITTQGETNDEEKEKAKRGRENQEAHAEEEREANVVKKIITNYNAAEVRFCPIFVYIEDLPSPVSRPAH